MKFDFFKSCFSSNTIFILEQLIKVNLALRYRRTFFGYIWTLLNPILMMTVTSIVFSTIFKLSLKDYAVFLFSGMICYNTFSQIVSLGSDSIINQEALIKKIPINKFFFPLSIAFTCAIDGMLMFLSLIFLMAIVGTKFSFALFFLPVSFFLLLIFSFGIALIFSVLTVYFRDLKYLIGVLLQALMFLSPVLYKPAQIAGKLQTLMAINPITYFIELFRAPIYLGEVPQPYVIMLAALASLVSLLVGVYIYKKNDSKLIFNL